MTHNVHRAHSRATELVATCTTLGFTLAVAESLTGGLLAAEIVGVPGASRVFRGGIVAYDTALKASLLGVDPELLAREGPVHEHVARQMADGVRRACAVDRRDATIGLATTGVAGPDPDPQTGQPAGTVWIAWSVQGDTKSERLQLPGGRARVRQCAVAAVFERVLLNLSQDHSDPDRSRE